MINCLIDNASVSHNFSNVQSCKLPADTLIIRSYDFVFYVGRFHGMYERPVDPDDREILVLKSNLPRFHEPITCKREISQLDIVGRISCK